MKKAVVYTRTGDDGTTSLIGGNRVAKDHPRVEAYGTLDELNAMLGILAVSIDDNELCARIEEIERNIILISTALANENCNTPAIGNRTIEELEQEIDRIDATLAPIHDFLLPGKSFASAQANLCRTVCRRAERRIVTLADSCKIEPRILVYINRISDYLFTLSRFLNNRIEKNR